MHIKDIIKHYWGELVYIFSSTYTLGISMLVGLVATAFIDPSDMGVIHSVLLVEVYVSFLQLGVFNGLNRNLAFYKAQGKKELVQDMVNTTYTVSYIVAVTGLLVTIGIFVYYLFLGKPLVYFFSVLLLGFHLVFVPLSNAVETTYRSGQEFKRLGIIKNIESTLYAFFTIFPIFFGYIGKVISDSLKLVAGYLLRYHKRPYVRNGRGSISSLKDLIKSGFPILVSGYVWTVFTACDRTYIASYLGMEQMGLYAISNYVMIAVMAVPTAVNTLLYPKAAARFGATGDKSSLMGFWKKSLLLYAAMLLPLCVVLYFVLPFLVEAFMPKYVGGIRAAQLSLLTCMTFIYRGPSVIFGTLRRNTLYIILLSLSIACFWGGTWVFRDYMNNIESVTLLRFVISFIQMVIIILVTYKFIK